MHIDFDPLEVEWSVLPDLTNESIQSGGGGVPYNIFRGMAYQRGSGLGSVFRSFLRYLIPVGKKIGAAIGRQGLESGNRVLSDVLEGKDLKESVINESKAGLKNLLEKAANNLDQQKGQGFDFKRYKNIDADERRVGKMIKKKPITIVVNGDKQKGRKNINRLSSRLGPPNFLPSFKVKKQTSKQKRFSRVDALGQY